MKALIATGQFSISERIGDNLSCIIELAESAAGQRADLLHLPECCLGGYAGQEIETWDAYPWAQLRDAQSKISGCAKALGLSIVYGTNHQALDGTVANRTVALDASGKEVATYDKRFCTPRDLRHYQSGRQWGTFDLHGIKIGLLICYDVRFPELYREYQKQKVNLILQSFYNAGNEQANIHSQIMTPTIQARAATNHMWISAANCSKPYQAWPSVFITPDGVIQSYCKQHEQSLICNEVDLEAQFYDASAPFRDNAMNGKLFSETT